VRENVWRGKAPELLLGAIADPRMLVSLSSVAWEPLLSCARRNGVLAYLAGRAEAARITTELPPAARDALRSAGLSAARTAQLAVWELDQVRRVLQPAAVPVIALKGVAYLVRGLPHAVTRRMADIDVMVPRERLADAESALLAAGWAYLGLDAYDQQYYRRWAHELPPLQFPGRMLSVDVHHTVCPPHSRLRPDPESLWAESEASPDDEQVRLLSPVDATLHAAVHLFFDSDFDGRFRDLVDLHELLAAFGSANGFWPRLVTRARAQRMGRPLYYALRTLRDLLATPVPHAVLAEAASFAPGPLVAAWMRRTLRTVLTPVDPEPWPPRHRGPLWMLYVRSHWLRMPPHRLAGHLLRKSIRRATA
jgi:hypothetical protein